MVTKWQSNASLKINKKSVRLFSMHDEILQKLKKCSMQFDEKFHMFNKKSKSWKKYQKVMNEKSPAKKVMTLTQKFHDFKNLTNDFLMNEHDHKK